MSISVSQRWRVLKRDKFTCQYCGAMGVCLEVDHVIPQSKGGSDDDDNLKAACIACNRGKSDDDPPEFALPPSSAGDLFVMTKNGHFTGKVIAELENTWRIECYDAFLWVGCALAQLCGAVEEVSKADARIFNDLEAMYAAWTRTECCGMEPTAQT